MVIIVTGGMAAPILASASSLWGAYNTGTEIANRINHRQSVNPLTDPTAFGLWLSLSANTFGIAAFASEAKLASITANESRIGLAGMRMIQFTKNAAVHSNAADTAYGAINTINHWDDMSSEERLKALSFMGFSAVTMLAAGKQAHRPGEMFSPTALNRRIDNAFEPPVEFSTELPGNSVAIETDLATGERKIMAGFGASRQDLLDSGPHQDCAPDGP